MTPHALAVMLALLAIAPLAAAEYNPNKTCPEDMFCTTNTGGSEAADAAKTGGPQETPKETRFVPAFLLVTAAGAIGFAALARRSP